MVRAEPWTQKDSSIVEPQTLYSDLADVNPSDILRWSPKLREAFNARYQIAHHENPAINQAAAPPISSPAGTQNNNNVR